MENIEENVEEEIIELSPAEKYYQNHLNRMREYNKKNRDLVNERNRQYSKKIQQDPEKREKYLQKKRDAYANIDPEKKEMMLRKKREYYQQRKFKEQQPNEN